MNSSPSPGPLSSNTNSTPSQIKPSRKLEPSPPSQALKQTPTWKTCLLFLPPSQPISLSCFGRLIAFSPFCTGQVINFFLYLLHFISSVDYNYIYDKSHNCLCFVVGFYCIFDKLHQFSLLFVSPELLISFGVSSHCHFITNIAHQCTFVDSDAPSKLL